MSRTATNIADLMGAAEAARALNIATRTLARYRIAGRIPYVRYSARKYVYRRADVEQFAVERYRDACPYEW